MRVRTIDQDYEYQMKDHISQLLKNFGKSIADFDTNDDLMDFVERKKNELGHIVAQHLFEYTDDWKERIQSDTLF